MGSGTKSTLSTNREVHLLDALLDALADRIAARLRDGAPPSGDLLTVDEAAELLKTTKRWIYAHADELGAIHLTRRKLRIPRAGVERRLARGRR
jgi:excisionase family DNA binding protein